MSAGVMKLNDLRATVKKYSGWTIRQYSGVYIASKTFADTGTQVRFRNLDARALLKDIQQMEDA